MATWINAVAIFLSLSIYGVRGQDECVIDRSSEFPRGFKFGSATASYQIEGAWNEDGRGPSIWDTTVHEQPEKIVDRSTGDVADDSYHKYPLDIAAIKEVGFDFYRFSISWSRILPDGQVSSLNPKGIDYYNNLINALLQAGIEPVVTIYHWDLPQALQDIGGWTNPLIVDYYGAYADVLFKNYGDRVKRWITFNEPFEFAYRGYGPGEVPPFIKGAGVAEYLSVHHMLTAHARAYHIYQDNYVTEQRGQVGITLNCSFYFPKNDTVDPSVVERALQFNLGWFAHAIFTEQGGYPPIMVQDIAAYSAMEGLERSRLPEMDEELTKYIRGSADFLGLNYYSSRLVDSYPHREGVEPSYANDAHYNQYVDPSWPRAKSDWLYSVPEGLRGFLNWMDKEYNGVEIIITEIGWSDDGELNDVGRTTYYRDHLEATLEAILCDGVNVSGFTAWSLIDNFEWLRGYTERFGLYNVNFNSTELERTPKSSARFMQQVVLNRRIPELGDYVKE